MVGNVNDFNENEKIFSNSLKTIFEKEKTLNCSDAICLLTDYLCFYNKYFKNEKDDGFILKNDDLTELFVRRFVEQSFEANYSGYEEEYRFDMYLLNLRERYNLYCDSLDTKSLLFKGYDDEGISSKDSDLLCLPEELCSSDGNNEVPVDFKVLKNGDFEFRIYNRTIAKNLVRAEEILKNRDFWQFIGENYFEQGDNPHLSLLRNHYNGNKFLIKKQNLGFLFCGYLNYLILAYINRCELIKHGISLR